jgi:hypothetical protein
MFPNEIRYHIFQPSSSDLPERHLYTAITIRDPENGHLPLEEGYVLSQFALNLLVNKNLRHSCRETTFLSSPNCQLGPVAVAAER